MLYLDNPHLARLAALADNAGLYLAFHSPGTKHGDRFRVFSYDVNLNWAAPGCLFTASDYEHVQTFIAGYTARGDVESARGVKAEDAARDILRRLVEWAEHMGGWEAPAWAEARQLLGLGDPEDVPEGFEIRHDLVGFYACTDEEAEWEDEGHESVGFDGRPHFESIGECADWLRRQQPEA